MLPDCDDQKEVDERLGKERDNRWDSTLRESRAARSRRDVAPPENSQASRTPRNHPHRRPVSRLHVCPKSPESIRRRRFDGPSATSNAENPNRPRLPRVRRRCFFLLPRLIFTSAALISPRRPHSATLPADYCLNLETLSVHTLPHNESFLVFQQPATTRTQVCVRKYRDCERRRRLSAGL